MTSAALSTASPGARQYVDFHEVPAHHLRIDARLANWGRWSHNPTQGASCSPMFSRYRSADPLRQYASASTVPVDKADALRVQMAMADLTVPQRLALSWCYIRRNNPARAATSIGVTLLGLKALIDTGRDALAANLD